MEIVGAEIGSPAQFFPVADRYPSFAALIEAFPLKRAQHPIDVHGCYTQRIAKLLLGHGNFIGAVVGQPDRVKPDRKLTE